MAPQLASTARLAASRRQLRRGLALAGLLGAFALLLLALAPTGASAATIPVDGNFQSWTASPPTAGLLQTVTTAQGTSGTENYWQTNYSALAGTSLLGNLTTSTQSFTSPTFTYSAGPLSSLAFTADESAQLANLLTLGGGITISATLNNTTPGAATPTTALGSTTLSTNQPAGTFATLNGDETAAAGALIDGDTYTLTLTETFSPSVSLTLASTASLELANVGLIATPVAVSAPTITAGSAAIQNVTQTGATAVVTVDPGNQPTTVTVNYGVPPSFASSAQQTVPAGTSPVNVTIPLSGLSPSTTYDANIVAANATSSVTATVPNFTTQAATSNPAPGMGTSVDTGTPGERTATDSTTVTTGGLQTTYYVQYGPTTGYGSSSPIETISAGGTDPHTATSSLTGLTPGTTYHAQFVATGPGGTSYGPDFTFTTASLSAPSLTQPTQYQTTNTAGTAISADATVDPGANDTEVTVAWGTSPTNLPNTTASHLVPGGSGATSVQIPITGLTEGQQYFFQVTATNSDGTATDSATAFTPNASTTPPVGPTSTTLDPPQHAATLGATITTGTSPASYFIEYGTTDSYGSSTTTQTLPASTAEQPLTATIVGLAPATTYHARFVVILSNGTESLGQDATFTTNSLATVAGTSVSGTSDTGATLTTTVDPGQMDTQVEIEFGPTTGYGTDSSSQTVPAGSGPTTLTFPLSGLAAGTTYHFQVIALNGAGTERSGDLSFATSSGSSTTTTTSTTTTGGSTTTAGSGSAGSGSSTTGASGSTTNPVSGPGTGTSCVAAYVSGSAAALKMLSVAAGSQVTAGHSLRIGIAARAGLHGKASYRIGAGKTAKTGRAGAAIALAQLQIGHQTAVHFTVPRTKHRATLHLVVTIHALACGTQVTETHPSASAVALTLRTPTAARQATFTVPASWRTATRVTVITATRTETVKLVTRAGKLALATKAGALKLVRQGQAITVSGLPADTTGVTLRFRTAGTKVKGPVAVRVVRVKGGAKTVHIDAVR